MSLPGSPAVLSSGKTEILIPAGAALILTGSAAIPSGFTLWNPQTGRILMGANPNGGIPVGTTASAASSVNFTGTTGTAGSHSGYGAYTGPATASSGATGGFVHAENISSTQTGDHSHSISGSVSATNAVPTKTFRIIQAQQDSLAPAGSGLLAYGGTPAESVSLYPYAEYLTMGTSDSTYTPGNGYTTASWTTNSAGAHTHYSTTQRALKNAPSTCYLHVSSGGHTHTGTTSVYFNGYYFGLTLYTVLSEVALLPGVILIWPSASAPPAGWSICDGSNTTPDLRGRLIRLRRDGAQGTSNYLRFVPGDTNSAGAHTHAGSVASANAGGGRAHPSSANSEDGSHAHWGNTIPNVAWTPAYYAVNFIKYTG